MNIFERMNNILIDKRRPSNEIEKLFLDKNFNESDLKIIKNLKDIKQELKFHPEGSVWNHTKLVIDIAAQIKEYTNNKEYFMWAALFHDIGKITTTKIIKGRYTSYNHDREGEKITYNILKEYKDEKFAKQVSNIVLYHMHHIYILKKLPFSNIKGLIKSSNFEDIILLFICDKLGRGNQDKTNKEKVMEEIYDIIKCLEKNNNINLDNLKEKIDKVKNILIK